MTPERWLVLSVRAPSAELVEELAEALVALGGPAVEERGLRLTTYLAEPGAAEPAVERARELLEDVAGEPLELEWRWQAHEDWAERWKRGLAPRRVGDRVIVAPSWAVPETGPRDALVVVDPEMAFGTGEHATTRGVLRLLERAIRSGDRVLDVGAGSGILSIAAAKLGAAEVLGIEGDGDAVETAARNLERNAVADRVRIRQAWLDADAAAALEPGWDLILANILSGVIIPLLPSFERALAPRGRLIVSGILEHEAEAVLAAAREAGFAVRTEDREEDWWSALLARRHEAQP